jgi:hypothetical protein
MKRKKIYLKQTTISLLENILKCVSDRNIFLQADKLNFQYQII